MHNSTQCPLMKRRSNYIPSLPTYIEIFNKIEMKGGFSEFIQESEYKVTNMKKKIVDFKPLLRFILNS